MDLLLNDMGVKNRSKSGFLEELVSPYTPGDFAGLAADSKVSA